MSYSNDSGKVGSLFNIQNSTYRYGSTVATLEIEAQEYQKMKRKFNQELLEVAKVSDSHKSSRTESPFPNPTTLGLLLPSAITTGVVGPGFFYGGVAQCIEAVATLFTLEKENVLMFGADSNQVIGILLVGYTIFSLYLWIGSFAHHLALIIIISLLEITLILLSLANFGVISSVPGSVTGILLSTGGWYFSAAIFVNENLRRTIIPVGDITNIPFLRRIAFRD
eukprot:jgi/Galph1/3098/GphlegSOOS_G1780.1